MSEFEAEVKKAEQELEQSLVPVGGEPYTGCLLYTSPSPRD